MFNYICIVSLLLSASLAEKYLYTNYTLYKVVPQSVDQIKLLQNLQNSDVRYDFWNDPVPKAEFVSILSSPEDKAYLDTFLTANRMAHQILSSNIQEEIDKEKFKKYARGDTRSMDWVNYFSLEDINSWMDDLIATHSVATAIVGGTTYEGRSIKGIKISHGSGRRAIFVEGGIHSREFISPATVNYITNELLTSDNEDIMAAARDFDWYIFPVTNPDGYIWAYESVRMWRKNRRPIPGSTHYGVDLNRNWNNNWLVEGSSVNPQADNYAGPGPFSEIESRSLSNYISSIPKIDMYLSFHSFGQLLLLPFGNTTQPLANYDDAMKIGTRAMEVLSQRHGTEYVIGNVAEAIYLATGGSIDWVKERLKVPLVYCYELRDRSSFVLPVEQILPNCEETMDSIVELIREGRRIGYFNSASRMSGSIAAAAILMFTAKYLLGISL